MKVGGVQKSLYNLLWAIKDEYDITLCLFEPVGEYLDKLPPSVRIVETGGLFRYLGISQGECKTLREKLTRGFLAAWCKTFGRSGVMKLIASGTKKLAEDFDCAIAFLHNGSQKSFYGGVQEFVLNRVSAKRKVAFLHCDYRNCGANNKYDNALIARFDRIAACSDGCRKAFESVLPGLKNKTVTVRNCHRFDEIASMANIDPVVYDDDSVNVIMVSRLAHEKGIDRALEALAYSLNKGVSAKLHIVGGGPMKAQLVNRAAELGIADSVFFYGEQSNPYRYMKNADLFLVTSYHEAAPMVIEEAIFLGVPVFSVNTSSAEEMILNCSCGVVCDNTIESLSQVLFDIISDRIILVVLKNRVCVVNNDNLCQSAQFKSLIFE